MSLLLFPFFKKKNRKLTVFVFNEIENNEKVGPFVFSQYLRNFHCIRFNENENDE